MAFNNVLVLYQVTIYTLTLVLSLCVFIPIVFHLYDFKGDCLLFTNGSFRATDGQFVAEWASQGFCDFNIVLAAVSFILALTQLHRFISYLCHQTDATFLSAFVDVIVCVFMSFGALAGAIIVSMGFQVWCDAIMLRFEQCADAASNNIFKGEGIDTTMFYTQFGTAQFGIWCLWVCWVGLAVASLLKLCKYHQQENIRCTMTRERTRLIAEHRTMAVNA